MALLKGYTGSAMGAIMIFRDFTLLKEEKNKAKGKEISKRSDLTILTYNGLLSLLSVIATLITTFSLWQKSVKNYKLYGIIAGILWLLYNIFIFSIMGIILESIIFICSIIGFIKDNKKSSK